MSEIHGFTPKVVGYEESRAPGLRDRLMFDPELAQDSALVRGIAINLLVQRDQLWNKAQRVMNKSNSANDTYEQIPKSTLDELGAVMDFCRPGGDGDLCDHCGQPIWSVGGDGVKICYHCGTGAVT